MCENQDEHFLFCKRVVVKRWSRFENLKTWNLKLETWNFKTWNLNTWELELRCRRSRWAGRGAAVRSSGSLSAGSALTTWSLGSRCCPSGQYAVADQGSLILGSWLRHRRQPLGERQLPGCQPGRRQSWQRKVRCREHTFTHRMGKDFPNETSVMELLRTNHLKLGWFILLPISRTVQIRKTCHWSFWSGL